MKTRRHHNNKGTHQIRRGTTVEQVKHMRRRLGVVMPPKCVECGIDYSDPPSPMCPGCAAYMEHLA